MAEGFGLDQDGLVREEGATQEAVGRREQSKAANRQAILDAARRVFAQLGYEAASVRDIIRGTELASGTFYNYFKSKEEAARAAREGHLL
jgi:AcrR family transcriptional regulator